MPLNLVNYEKQTKEAVKAFWGNRAAARDKQIALGKIDQGERAAVTSGKNMDGFSVLIVDLIRNNGLKDAEIHQKRALLTLPGYFRPTKLWDMVVMREGRLVAAIELKSQVGPSFGNNFNNRTEEAIGTARFLDCVSRRRFREKSEAVSWLVDDGGGRAKVPESGSGCFTALRRVPGV